MLEIFYRAVSQAILLYGSETWVLSAEMDNKLEGLHTDFLRHITGNRERQIVDGTQETPGAGVMKEMVGTHSEMTYIGRQQATVAQWVALRPIFEVCSGEKVYKGGGRRREDWWLQEATERQLRENLEGVSREAKTRILKGERLMQWDTEEGGD